jgi:serine/threonine protein kinase
VKLVDFGVAKAMGRLSETTRAGQLKGKFGYMAPEQAQGRDADRRSDVFALGIVLYELTTSRRLFRGKNDVETLQLVVGGAIPRPSRIDPSYPPELERIVLHALERDPNQRYQTAHELETDLRGYLKAERIVVPVSGVAGLLKRVLGNRIEQRRKAVRKAIKSLETGEYQVVEPELISQDPAFTPTGNDTYQVEGVGESSSVSEVSSLSQIGLVQSSGTDPRSGGKGAAPYFLLLLVVIATVLGVLVAMNKLRIPGLTPAASDAGGDDVSSVVDSGPDVELGSGADRAARSVPGDEVRDAATPQQEAGVPTLSLEELELEREQVDRDAAPDTSP